MNKDMEDFISKETSDKYSEIYKDICDIVSRNSDKFDSNRELEYWIQQAVTAACVQRRLMLRRGVR